MKHVQNKIRAWLDGELPDAEAATVRQHCEICPQCRRTWQEMAAVWDTLALAAAPRLPRPIWPELEAKLVRREPAWHRVALATGGVATAAAGLLLGLWLGTQNGNGQISGWPSLVEQGALFVEGTDLTLDQLYLAAGAEEGEVQP